MKIHGNSHKIPTISMKRFLSIIRITVSNTAFNRREKLHSNETGQAHLTGSCQKEDLELLPLAALFERIQVYIDGYSHKPNRAGTGSPHICTCRFDITRYLPKVVEQNPRSYYGCPQSDMWHSHTSRIYRKAGSRPGNLPAQGEGRTGTSCSHHSRFLCDRPGYVYRLRLLAQ